MALDRDIFWVGRQWAVTGLGVQAVDQRLKGAFDVAAARLWEDDLPRRMRDLAWINIDDFDKALDLARARFPAPPPKKNLPLVESVLELMLPPGQEAPRPPPPMQASSPETVIDEVSLPEPVIDEVSEPQSRDLTPILLPPEPSIPESNPLALRIEHVSAKFLPRWRIRSGSQ